MPFFTVDPDDVEPSHKTRKTKKTGHGYNLASEDKSVLLSWLNDRLINVAQEMLKQTAPSPVGLQDVTLGNTLAYNIQTSEFVQILHDGHQHWVTISTIGAKRNEIFIYNSLGTSVSSSVKNQIAALLCSKESHITLQFVDVQQQTGGYDCGLYAIAYATTLINGQQPGNFCFAQGLMRKHLYKCISNGRLTVFTAKARKSRGVISTDILELYCSCRMPEIIPMVMCSKCEECMVPQ